MEGRGEGGKGGRVGKGGGLLTCSWGTAAGVDGLDSRP
jgi:hypothetical protein